jgi:hypothetical protein
MSTYQGFSNGTKNVVGDTRFGRLEIASQTTQTNYFP